MSTVLHFIRAHIIYYTHGPHQLTWCKHVRGLGNFAQNGDTTDMIFTIADLIAVISEGITLYPGDIIATGTPAGVGAGFKPPKFLTPGDKVRVAIDGIGELENIVGN